jgi:hypothetical protein
MASLSQSAPFIEIYRSPNRRRSKRYPVNGVAEFRARNWYPHRGRVLNICLEGCLIEPRGMLEYAVGDELDIRFEVHRVALRARAVVRRISPSGKLGVELIQLSDRGRADLISLISELDDDTLSV